MAWPVKFAVVSTAGEDCFMRKKCKKKCKKSCLGKNALIVILCGAAALVAGAAVLAGRVMRRCKKKEEEEPFNVELEENKEGQETAEI